MNKHYIGYDNMGNSAVSGQGWPQSSVYGYTRNVLNFPYCYELNRAVGGDL